MKKLYLFTLGILLSALVVSAQPNYFNPIKLPPVLDAADGPITLQMTQAIHDFNPNNPGTDSLNGRTTFCYNDFGSTEMTLLGPTLIWHTGDSAEITVVNDMPQPTTTHWHGAEVPVEMDGGPHQPIPQDSSWKVTFKVLDSAATMWYHPHYHNRTVQQVQMGLSGMVIIQQAGDTIAPKLPQTYGVDDIPLIIGDAGIKNVGGGQFELDTLKGKRPTNVVNGVTNPFVEVPAEIIRFRILNGSTRKGLSFGFAESSPTGNLLPFTLIATDGGYVLEPTERTHMINGPGARDEVLIDLRNYIPGDVLYLRNLNDLMPGYIVGSPNPAPGGGGGDATGGAALLEIRIVPSTPGHTPISEMPTWTRTWNVNLADTIGTARHRTKKLVFIPKDPDANPPRMENMFNIDSTTFDMMKLNDTVCVNTKEIWTIDNTTAVAHPFHIHKIQFRILEIDSMGTMIDLKERGLNGPKDDVLVLPGWKLSFLGYFENYPTEVRADKGYMYHCHILTHEDSIGGGMMHQFAVAEKPACEEMAVGIKAPSAPLHMHLYPNPARGILHLEGHADSPSEVNFLDLSGRTVKTLHLPPFEWETPLEIADLPSGMYLVRWKHPVGNLSRMIRLE